MKVIGRLPRETSCLRLIWAVPDRASQDWRGFTMNTIAHRRLQDLGREHLSTHNHHKGDRRNRRVTPPTEPTTRVAYKAAKLPRALGHDRIAVLTRVLARGSNPTKFVVT